MEDSEEDSEKADDGIQLSPHGSADDIVVRVRSTLASDLRTAIIAIVSALAANNLPNTIIWVRNLF